MTDVGKSLFCRVTATNAAGSASADSNTVGPVTAAGGGGGAFTLLANTNASGAGHPDPITTPAIDTTGADLLIVGVSEFYYAAEKAVVTDSKGNTWTQLDSIIYANRTSIWYCKPTTVGTDHTVTLTKGGAAPTYAGFTFAAFSGAAASPFDLTIADGAAGSPIGPGAGITPTLDNSLVISNVAGQSATSATVSSPFTAFTMIPAVGATNICHCMAYVIQTTKTLADPDWTLSPDEAGDTILASFKAV